MIIIISVIFIIINIIESVVLMMLWNYILPLMITDMPVLSFGYSILIVFLINFIASLIKTYVRFNII